MRIASSIYMTQNIKIKRLIQVGIIVWTILAVSACTEPEPVVADCGGQQLEKQLEELSQFLTKINKYMKRFEEEQQKTPYCYNKYARTETEELKRLSKDIEQSTTNYLEESISCRIMQAEFSKMANEQEGVSDRILLYQKTAVNSCWERTHIEALKLIEFFMQVQTTDTSSREEAENKIRFLQSFALGNARK